MPVTLSATTEAVPPTRSAVLAFTPVATRCSAGKVALRPSSSSGRRTSVMSIVIDSYRPCATWVRNGMPPTSACREE